MGLLDFWTKRNQAEAVPKSVVNDQEIKFIEIGSAGTEIFAGRIYEEYLRDLQGKELADIVDKMRRSDSNVKMVVSSLTLPLKASRWTVHTLEKSEMAEAQKKLIEKALFEDTGASFTKTIGEVLTCVPFGYSLFDVTFRVKFGDPELGDYNTLKSISFRSQRTIEQWNLDEFGKLKSVTQIANGDLGVMVDMPAQFLLHFAPEQEGSNFEGISTLRSIYGNWLRKNEYLKLMAAGIEKYAIPVPILTIPEGKENSKEYENALKALKKYTGNQSNYLTKPAGWELEIKPVTFDADKIRAVIDSENQEMANSILAQFLLLGQAGSSSSSHAQSDNLSDFFKQTLNFLANHISEQFGRKIITPVVKMNMGDAPVLVELRCEGLNDQADKAWADTIKVLMDAGGIKPDAVLEKYFREKLNLPEKDVETEEIVTEVLPTDPSNPPEPKQLAEKKKSKKPQGQTEELMISSAEKLRDLFKTYLSLLGTEYIDKLLKTRNKSTTSGEIKAPNQVDLFVPDDYLEGTKLILSVAAAEAKDQVEALTRRTKSLSEISKSYMTNRQLADRSDKLRAASAELAAATDAYVGNPLNMDVRVRLQKAREKFNYQARMMRKEIDDKILDFAEKQRIAAKASLLLDSQIADLKKNIGLQYQTSLPSTDSEDVIRKDLQERLEQTVSGPITTTGPDIMANQIVNETRFGAANALGEGLESYTFIAVDDERTTDICRSLDGRTFAPNDPDLKRFSPPLHYNCRSYFAINLTKYQDNPEITKEPLELSKKAQKQITLSEVVCCEHGSKKDEHSEFLMGLKIKT